MTPVVSLDRAALVALLALGCGKNPDPNHLALGDFVSGNQLSDTLRKLIPVGTRIPVATEMMQRNGFVCGERAPIKVDVKTRTLGSGKPNLECYKSSRLNLGMQRRDWTVVFAFDTTGIKGLNSGYIIQP